MLQGNCNEDDNLLSNISSKINIITKSNGNNLFQQTIDHISLDMFLFQFVLGVGGFGKVISTILKSNQTWYAMKVISKNHIIKVRSGIEMLYNELNALKRLNYHPFIVGLHYAFHNESHCFFALDLKQGGDLRYHLRKHGVFNEQEVAIYVACITSALSYIHSKGIIHRDIKPENIVLDQFGYPSLVDFGISYVKDDNDHSKLLLTTQKSGTKQYLAPEIFTKSNEHGPESDFWSLGVVVYEITYGKKLFIDQVPQSYIAVVEKYQSNQLTDDIVYNYKRKLSDLNINDYMTSKRSVSSLSNSTELISPHKLDFDEISKVCIDSTNISMNIIENESNIKFEVDNIIHPSIPTQVHTSNGVVNISNDFINLLSGLLTILKVNRLSSNSTHSILSNPWFKSLGLNSNDIISKNIIPYYVPGDKFIEEYCDYYQSHKSMKSKGLSNYQNESFDNFYYMK